MTFVSYKAQNTITLPVRDWQVGVDTLAGYNSTWRVQMVLYSKDGRTDTIYNVTSPTFDADTREFTFTYNTTPLDAEVVYMIRLTEQTFNVVWTNTKILAFDRLLMLPSGQTTSTYQPVLPTVEETMNNQFKIYGE